MHERGFTLIEMLLSVAIMGIIAGISLPVYTTFQSRNDLAISTGSVAEVIRRAQNYARTAMYDSSWGVAVQSGTYTLFKGSSYVTRDTTYDEVMSLPASVVASGLSEVVFGEVTAAPSTTGTVTLTSSTGEVDTLTMNAEGMVAR